MRNKLVHFRDPLSGLWSHFSESGEGCAGGAHGLSISKLQAAALYSHKSFWNPLEFLCCSHLKHIVCIFEIL